MKLLILIFSLGVGLAFLFCIYRTVGQALERHVRKVRSVQDLIRFKSDLLIFGCLTFLVLNGALLVVGAL